MSASRYWIIDYSMEFLSDFHVGVGITLMGGNLHGIRRDENGLPYLPLTQVQGLMRQRGWLLSRWRPQLNPLFKNNFRDGHQQGNRLWSYTRARFQDSILMWKGADLKKQSHIHIDDSDEVADNLYSFQKGGAVDEHTAWTGSIYSVEPSSEQDVAFLITAMRADDRMGHRRSRGYGKVNWEVTCVRTYDAGQFRPQVDARPLEQWIDLVITGGDQ